MTPLLIVLFATLPEQTMVQALDRQVESYVLYDLRARAVAGFHWEQPDRPVAMGSVIKPFTALSYAEEHEFRYPEFECRGERDHCWLPKGHGRLRIEQAVAHSCNAWFLDLARRMTVPAALLARFGLGPVPDQARPETLVGFGSEWKFTPLGMASAYADLLSRREQPGVSPLIAGMRLAAREGTASPLGQGFLAKTGTAPCDRHPGDGFMIAVFPSAAPRYLVLVRAHGTTGAKTAARAAPVLRCLAGQ